MSLLEFARGPMLAIALVVMAAGIVVRLRAILRAPPAPGASAERPTVALGEIVKPIVRRVILPRELRARIGFGDVNAWLFHIGLLVAAVAYAPHIAFVRRLTGFVAWPALPDIVTYFCGALCIVSLIIALMHRLSHPAMRLISRFDDYFSWCVTFLAVATGMMAVDANVARTDTMLAIHLLAVELMLIWLPFGKLSHAFLLFVSHGLTSAEPVRKGARP